MQLDGTLQLPDGQQIPIVVEVNKEQAAILTVSSSAEIIIRAMEVLGSREKALAWFHSPVSGLGDRRPLDVIETVEGRRDVENILGQIEHGIFG